MSAPSELLRQKFASHVLAFHAYRGQPTVTLRREALFDAARYLKEEPGLAFNVLMDLTAVDYLKFGAAQSSAPRLATPSPLPYYMTAKPSAEAWERGVSNDQFRFEVVYHLFSTVSNRRLRVKVPLAAADPVIASVTPLWATANWFEREAWDLFGIRFDGHPDLRRLLMYEEFS
ncbi:MAG: NADH-quinone oxidoreductase subunit C, partial [Dehalococcoidia bacterium]|nr:NADH-quinone oxidoreductase subunit C [Dehalococcoidia bacterium]